MTMTRILAVAALALTVTGIAPAATTNTTLTVTATGTFGATGLSASGTATLKDIGNGTFTGSLSTTDLAAGKPATFSIVLPTGTLNGTLLIPTTLLTSILTGTATSGTASATITGGTSAFAGATGSFPTLNGSGSATSTGFTLNFTGDGTITTGGGTTTPTPTISAVLDAGSYTKNLAQGGMFVVKGTNMGGSGLSNFDFPLPTTSPTGIKVTFTPTSGGAGTDAYLVYTYNQGGVN
jgi:hypothetical protein